MFCQDIKHPICTPHESPSRQSLSSENFSSFRNPIRCQMFQTDTIDSRSSIFTRAPSFSVAPGLKAFVAVLQVPTCNKVKWLMLLGNRCPCQDQLRPMEEQFDAAISFRYYLQSRNIFCHISARSRPAVYWILQRIREMFEHAIETFSRGEDPEEAALQKEERLRAVEDAIGLVGFAHNLSTFHGGYDHDDDSSSDEECDES